MGVASDDSDTNPMIVASSDDADRDDNNNNSENNKSASTAATDAIHTAAPDREAKGEGGVATDDVIDAASDTPLSVHGDVEKRNDVPVFMVSSMLGYKPGGSKWDPYLPGVPVMATVTVNHERWAHHFYVEFEHGDFSWMVKKYYSDFLLLRSSLAPFRLIRRSGRRGRGRHRSTYLPHLLSIQDVNPRRDVRVAKQCVKVQRLLNAVLSDRQLRTRPSTLKFMEISRFSFIRDLGRKHKEGVLTKRSGGYQRVTNCLGCTACCLCKCSVWRHRWFVLKDSYAFYIRDSELRQVVAGVLLFDQWTRIFAGLRETHLQYGIKIRNSSRELLLKCPSHSVMKEWKYALKRAMMLDSGKQWLSDKPYHSFAPARADCTVKWFVDGEGYMEAVASALLSAKEEIFITDWMLSPQIYLKRKGKLRIQDRLDHILKQKADEGVRVFIQLYKEVPLALDLGSEHVLESLSHENIVVLRHPEHIQTGVYLWSHHEKLVVIDQSLAFLGGLDLCFGRWDTARHSLIDAGAAPRHHTSVMQHIVSIGHDMQHRAQVKQTTSAIATAANRTTANSTTIATVHTAEERPTTATTATTATATDLEESVTSTDNRSSDNIKLVDMSSPSSPSSCGEEQQQRQHDDGSGSGRCVRDVDVDVDVDEGARVSGHETTASSSRSSQVWVGKDYYNPFITDFVDLHIPHNDLMDRGCARMPWHDVACCLYGQPARDVARHFIQRHNFTKHEQALPMHVPFLLPRCGFGEREGREMSYLLEEITKEGSSSSFSSGADVQILRSVGMWSCGVATESSIYLAYLTAITMARHFVYIENQFFISSLPSSVQNSIADNLRRKISLAHIDGTMFRIFIVMPLLPSFPGEFGESDAVVKQSVVHWNSRTISWGEDSLMGKLVAVDGVPESDLKKYISVCGLRKYQEHQNKLRTEIVYVHSKLMIVDDRITIMGSANINDRSMMGDRDSEIAVVIKDHDMVDGEMNGECVKVGKFSHSLRKHLFREHLGMLDEQQQQKQKTPHDQSPSLSSPPSPPSPPPSCVDDPCTDEFFSGIWQKTADSNTEIYEEVFGGQIVPSNKVRRFKDFPEYKSNQGLVGTDMEKAREIVSEVRGHLVAMPLHFLEDEYLLPDISQREFYAPEKLLT